LKGKVLIDTTNPLAPRGSPPGLTVGHDDSGGEQVQRAAPEARVVKAFNTLNNARMFRPSYTEGDPDMLICGNDADAKAEVTRVLHDFGWKSVVDLGKIEGSRYLESFCILWVLYGIATGTWDHAVKFLRK
jgi:predicted dinucleotide-binding enzyme